jgi:hypothetical protein
MRKSGPLTDQGILLLFKSRLVSWMIENALIRSSLAT